MLNRSHHRETQWQQAEDSAQLRVVSSTAAALNHRRLPPAKYKLHALLTLQHGLVQPQALLSALLLTMLPEILLEVQLSVGVFESVLRGGCLRARGVDGIAAGSLM